MQDQRALNPPAHLGEEAAAEWTRIVAIFEDLGKLEEGRLALLEAYCVNYGRWVKAEKALREQGEIVKLPGSSTPIKNPYLDVANEASRMMRAYARDLDLMNVGTGPGAPTAKPKAQGAASMNAILLSDFKH